MSSYMNRLPTAWVIPHPDVKLIKRGNVYYSPRRREARETDLKPHQVPQIPQKAKLIPNPTTQPCHAFTRHDKPR